MMERQMAAGPGTEGIRTPYLYVPPLEYRQIRTTFTFSGVGIELGISDTRDDQGKCSRIFKYSSSAFLTFISS